ncbi:MAG: tyrosine-protein phosphatase [Bacilli bacterium]|nr:tyrosine-protein phosphatase [Bacilli bacterium]
MKKPVLLISMIAALLLVGCNNNKQPADTSKEEQSSVPSGDQSSAPEDKSASSSIPISYESKEEVINDNFTLLKPNDLSSMSKNCKKYVDDMRAQQQKLIKEKGNDADYYLNDLYGTSGVDLTKGVTPSSGNYQDNTGGYRDGTTQNDYLDPIGADYTKGEKSDENKGIEIEFRPAKNLENKEYTITYSASEDFSGAKTITSNLTKVYLKNLLVNQKYYVKVSADGKDSQTINFTTGDYPRWIDARPMFNVRDLGGYMTSSGQRIKQGLVYRGGEINKKTGWYGSQRYTDDTGNTQARDGHIVSETDASKKAFREDMGMINGLEIDLRSGGETNGYPSKSGYCDFAENNDISYKMLSISSYHKGMQQNTSQIKQLFEAFAQADQHPVYFHCYGGADRTGVVGFMLGALLGMSYTDLVIDFELTSYSSNPSRNYRSHLRNGPWNEWPGMVTYLKDTLGWEKGDTKKTIKQGIEEYLKNKCNISQATIDNIRNIMLEPAK